MKRLVFLLTFLLLPTLAHAQFQHTAFFNGGTTLTATCTNTTGTTLSQDYFEGTLQGNTTVTLPASATGCLSGDIIVLKPTAAASQSFTLTVSAGTGTALQTPSNGAVLIVAPTGAASGAANNLQQIWIYNSVAGTPQWELVTQEAVPASNAMNCPVNNVNCVTQLNNGATSTVLLKLDSSNNINVGAGNTNNQSNVNLNAGAAHVVAVAINGSASSFQVGATTVSATNGATIQSTGGAAPTLTAGCNGAGSSVAAGSTNNRGQITTQSAASTTCTITWSAAGTWNQSPFCVFMGTPGLVPGTCGTSTCVFSYTSISAATPINYLCM